jgi:chromosome segregation ATPase
MEAEIQMLEEEAAVACGAYDIEVGKRDQLNEEIGEMTTEKKAAMHQIEQEQGDLSSYQRDLSQATENKSVKEDELTAKQRQLADVEAKRNGIADDKRKFESDFSSFRKDIDDMKITIQKAL